MKAFGQKLQDKIDSIRVKIPTQQIGRLKLASPLILAPMASITSAPFRLLMEDLGAGATVSELISCKGISYGNQKTLDMLYIDPRENSCGIQLFGGDTKSMQDALKFVEERGVKFIDLNLGCPVKKVVASGGGAGLLKDTSKLAHYLKACRQAVSIPLSIKIRSGWDQLNADHVVKIASEEGIEFVAIHGRTAQMQYRGQADWDYIESIAKDAPLPIVGNGDLIHPEIVRNKLQTSHCNALMIGRGALRNPFLFLETFDSEITFLPQDYLEVSLRYKEYLDEMVTRDRVKLIQLKKHIAWFAAGFPGVARFRESIFKSEDQIKIIELTTKFFESQGDRTKEINSTDGFLSGGHG